MTEVTGVVAASGRSAQLQFAGRLPRLFSWLPLAISGLVAVGIIVWRYDTLESSVESAVVMRVMAVLAAIGVVYFLDDASRNITTSSVMTLRVRVVLRLSLMVVAATTFVALLALIVASQATLSGFWLGYSVEVATLVLLGAVFALLLQQRFGFAEPGHAASVGLLMAVVLMLLLSSRWPMFVMPGADWAESHQRWLGVLIVASTALIFQLRDPASQWPGIRRRTVGVRR